MIERGVIDFIPPEQVDDGSWLEDPEFAREFIPIQMLFLQRNHVTIDPTMSAERQKASADQGLFEIRFKPWVVYLNWSTQWQGRIPPHHYAVEFHGETLGILSPFALVRTCWKCRLGSPRVGSTWWPGLMYVRSVHPKAPPRWPWVRPAYPCWGPLENSYLIRTCGEMDWWARTIDRELVQRDAAEALAIEAETDSYASDMLGRDDPHSPGLARDTEE